MNLRDRRCEPCTGATPKLTSERAAALLTELDGWSLDGERISKTLAFPDFAAAMAFVNRMAEVAEREDHHPDFTVRYNRVDIVLWTHAIGGLSENDFVLASKIDAL